jgi:hypothetical protein
MGAGRETIGIGLPGHQCLQNRAAGHPVKVRDHRPELDVGRLEQFVNAIDHASSIADQALAMSRQVPERSNLRRRNEPLPGDHGHG